MDTLRRIIFPRDVNKFRSYLQAKIESYRRPSSELAILIKNEKGNKFFFLIPALGEKSSCQMLEIIIFSFLAFVVKILLKKEKFPLGNDSRKF